MNQLIRTDEIWGALNDFERKHAPKELFVAGDRALLTEGLRVAVVGSRKASDAGLKRAEQFAEAKENFPRRNRTMALISDTTVIVEAGEKSGTRHQGWEALRLGRLVFIMRNVAEDPNLTWPKEMIGYGAQVLSSEDLPEVLYDIPSFTAGGEVAF